MEFFLGAVVGIACYNLGLWIGERIRPYIREK